MVQGRKKVSFGLSAGRLVYLGSARVLSGVSRAEFRSSLAAVLVFESKFMTVQDL